MSLVCAATTLFIMVGSRTTNKVEWGAEIQAAKIIPATSILMN